MKDKYALQLIILLSLVGLFYLALVDSEYRPIFADLAKMGVGAYIGWMMKQLLNWRFF